MAHLKSPISKPARGLSAHLLLALVGALTLLPFLWMVLASFKTVQDIEGPTLVPPAWHPENYARVFQLPRVSFARYYFNSLFVAAWVTFLTCLTSAMAAFAFSRLRWRGRDTVFLLYLGTLMVPGVVTMIPNFALMVKLKLLDTYAGLIVPASFSAFGVFLLRQFMLTIPTSLDEAASIDGASKWQVFWDVILPLARPGLITLAIFAFLGNYGALFWPLVIVKSEHLRTLPTGMLYFDTQYGRETNLIMAASVMAIVPPLILFVVSQKFLVRGIQLGAVKG
jgi:ABC-type glycerol-3-phosphate transport system permease component